MFTHNPMRHAAQVRCLKPFSSPAGIVEDASTGPAPRVDRITGPLVRQILESACRRHDALSIATDVLQADAVFLWMDQEVLWVATTLSPEGQACLLCEGEEKALDIQFLTSNRIFKAQARLYQDEEGPFSNNVRLRIPDALSGFNQRRETRTHLPGTREAWFDLRDTRVFNGEVLNASEHGLAVLAGIGTPLASFNYDDEVSLSIFVNPERTLEAVGRVRHIEGNVLGLYLDSPLGAEDLAALAGRRSGPLAS